MILGVAVIVGDDFGGSGDSGGDYGATSGGDFGAILAGSGDSGGDYGATGGDGGGGDAGGSGDQYVGSIFGSPMGGGGDDKESGEDYGYEQTDQDYKYDDKYDGSGKSRSFVWVIVILCVAMLGVAGAYFWFIRKDDASVAALSANISEGDTTGLVLSADSLASDSLRALSGDTLAFVADSEGERKERKGERIAKSR